MRVFIRLQSSIVYQVANFIQTSLFHWLYNNYLQLEPQAMDFFSNQINHPRSVDSLQTSKEHIHTSVSHHAQNILDISQLIQASYSKDFELVKEESFVVEEHLGNQGLYDKKQTFGLEFHIFGNQHDHIELQQGSNPHFEGLLIPNHQSESQVLQCPVKDKKKEKRFSGCQKIMKFEKNSNAIKKIGRLILKNLHQFHTQNSCNQGVQNMLRQLSQVDGKRSKGKDIRDSFNMSHLQALFFNCPQQVSSHNLRILKNLLKKKLRKETLASVQIQDKNKLVYLNTLKSTALRCSNKGLAIRLQLSQSR